MSEYTPIERLVRVRTTLRNMISRPDAVSVDFHWSHLDDLDAAIAELGALKRQNEAFSLALDAALGRPIVKPEPLKMALPIAPAPHLPQYLIGGPREAVLRGQTVCAPIPQNQIYNGGVPPVPPVRP